jgi:hypothetical protein
MSKAPRPGSGQDRVAGERGRPAGVVDGIVVCSLVGRVSSVEREDAKRGDDGCYRTAARRGTGISQPPTHPDRIR